MNNKNKLNIRRLFAFVLVAVLLCTAGCSSVKDIVKGNLGQTAPQTVRIMFREGSTVADIAALLESKGVCTAADFMAQANNPQNLENFGFSVDNAADRAFVLEGYLFPDTYDFYLGESAETAILRFLKNTASKLDGEIKARCAELGYSLDEILTVASVIQGEASDTVNMKKVASVVHNRLASEHLPKLECDCATFYLRRSVKPYVDEARYAQLIDLYNTYNFEGLPAGAINNPGIEAINAALYPDETEYYFFASDDNGAYYYGETYEEHLAYCKEAGIIGSD